ncbi:MAG TPA: biopolymer transporter ExbD [Pyrinomonadaceae bacterium]|nr:biopolymer transporter ExbD [Pyrinomonadaceae bacterium]
MKLKFFLKIFASTLFLILLSSCAKIPIEQTVIVVKVPPFYDKKYSQYGNFLRFQDFLFPPKGISKDKIHYPDSSDNTGLPNDDSLLYVLVEANGKVKINNEPQGNVSDTQKLTERLKGVFEDREKYGVFEPHSEKIVKAIGIKTHNSVKYGDFFKVVEAVKQSGAEPIVLLFDDDARPKTIISTDDLGKSNK